MFDIVKIIHYILDFIKTKREINQSKFIVKMAVYFRKGTIYNKSKNFCYQ